MKLDAAFCAKESPLHAAGEYNRNRTLSTFAAIEGLAASIADILEIDRAIAAGL
ncbi:hypothetical protein [Methylobacter sp. BBA5.1]|uniref:hypothetical protein n=1 Tax=Methylobacter sp. BBA5.1 TaxID=1495064 RepID=UPI001376B0BE|nr:hypothetical protein [Methylobacter sp. BBA5.1]